MKSADNLFDKHRKPKKGSPPWESLPLHVKRKPL